MSRALFLPGAGGRRSFWQPVVRQLDPRIQAEVLAWPGFGEEPRDESIEDLSGLAAYVLQRMSEPCDLVAQSMGGVVAMSLALEHSDLVNRMVLTGTSGGIDVSRFGGEDWREGAGGGATAVETPAWFVEDRTDLTAQLPNVTSPVLLIWGADDRISPRAVGEYLASLLPHAHLELVPGDHDHPYAHPAGSAGLITAFFLAGRGA